MVPQGAVIRNDYAQAIKAWGHRVEFGCEVTTFAPATLSPRMLPGRLEKKVIIAHYLIGADGGGSFVKKR